MACKYTLNGVEYSYDAIVKYIAANYDNISKDNNINVINTFIYLNPDALTPETTFHELTHVQQQLLKQAAEKGDDVAKAVLSKFDKLFEQAIAQINSGNRVIALAGQKIDLSSDVYSKGKNESDADYNERMRDELWAYLQAPENVKKWEKANNRTLFDFVKDVVAWFKDMLGIKGLTVEQVQSATLSELLDYSSTSLMKGEYFDGEAKTQKGTRFISITDLAEQLDEEGNSKDPAKKERMTGKAIMAAENVNDLTKKAVTNLLYDTKKDSVLIQNAADYIQRTGIYEAKKRLISGEAEFELSGDEQIIVAQSVAIHLNDLGEYSEAAEMFDWLAGESTPAALKLRAFGFLRAYDANGMIAYVQRKFAKEKQGKSELIKAELEKVKKEFEEYKQKVAEEALNKVGKNSRKKDTTAAIKTERQKYVNKIKEIWSKKFGQNLGIAPDFEKQAREDVELMKAVGGLVRTYIKEGLLKLSDIQNKVKETLGFDIPNTILEEKYNSEKEKYLKKKISDVMDVKSLGELVRTTNIDENFLNNLTDKLIESGLTSIEAKELGTEVSNLIENQLRQMSAKKTQKRKSKEQLLKEKNIFKQNVDNILQKVALENLGIPTLSDEEAEKAKELHEKYKNAPKGTQEEADRFNDLTGFIVTRTDKFGKAKTLRAWMYFNMLSGMYTHVKNFLSNSASSVGNTLAIQLAGIGKENRSYVWGEAAKGLQKGVVEAGRIMKTGYDPVGKRNEGLGKIPNTAQVSDYLKNEDLNKGEKFVLWSSEIVSRLLKAGDAIFYFMNERVHHATLAHNIAVEEGLQGEAKEARVNEILNANFAPQSSQEYALTATYNNTPTGSLGVLYELIEKNNVWDKGEKRKLLKTIVLPFVRVPLNILNEKLNWTPIGIARAMRKNGVFLTKDNPRTSPVPSFGNNEERKMLLAKGLMGTLAIIGFAAINSSDDDDDDFYITSFLSKDTANKNQIMNEGVKPNSIKFGNNFYNYGYFGQSMPLFIAGLTRDLRMYNQDLSDDEIMTLVSFYGGALAHDFFLQTPLTTANDLMNAVGSNNEQMKALVQKVATRTIATGTLGNNLLLSINRTIDDKLYTTADMKSAMMRSFPVSMSFARPRLNTLGEEIHLGKVGSLGYNMDKDETHKVYKLFVEKDYVLRNPNYNVTLRIDGKKTQYKELSPEDQDKFLKIRGQEIKKRVLEQFNSLDKKDKENFDKAIKSIVDDATGYAKNNF